MEVEEGGSLSHHWNQFYQILDTYLLLPYTLKAVELGNSWQLPNEV